MYNKSMTVAARGYADARRFYERAAACASGLNESAWADELRQKARALPQAKDLMGALDLA